MYDLIFIGEKLKTPKLRSLCIEANSLMECKGEIGNFSLKFKDKESAIKTEESKYIIINLKAVRENPIENTYLLSKDLTDLTDKEDIIIIQDYQKTSPAVINKEALKKAISAKENFEDNEVYYLYRSMRFIDDNDNLYEQARKMGILFLQYEMDGIEILNEKSLNYKRGDLDLNLEGQILTAPLLKPNPKIKRIARLLNIEMRAEDYLQAENIYLQPTLTGKRGVYALAGARGPNAYSELDFEIEYTLNEIASNLDNFEPITERKREVDDQKCILCYTCYRVCPHGAIEEDEELDAMKIHELACQGCDACLSHCPADAISFVEQDTATKDQHSLKVMMCENSADTAFKKLDKDKFDDLEIEKIPCASSIKKDDIFKFIREKDSRLLILGCFEDSCKHLTGDGRGKRIVEEVKETLDDLDLGASRVRFERLSPRMEEDLNDFLLNWKEGGKS